MNFKNTCQLTRKVTTNKTYFILGRINTLNHDFDLVLALKTSDLIGFNKAIDEGTFEFDDTTGMSAKSNVLEALMLHGSLECAIFLLSRFILPCEMCLGAAFKSRRNDIVQWLLKQNGYNEILPDILLLACRQGMYSIVTKIIKHMKKIGMVNQISGSLIDIAIYNDNLRVAVYLLNNIDAVKQRVRENGFEVAYMTNDERIISIILRAGGSAEHVSRAALTRMYTNPKNIIKTLPHKTPTSFVECMVKWHLDISKANPLKLLGAAPGWCKPFYMKEICEF